VDSPCVGLSGARRPACTTHQSGYRLARFPVWGPAWIKRWPAFLSPPGLRESQQPTSQHVRPVSQWLVARAKCQRAQRSRAPDGNLPYGGIVQERSAHTGQTDRPVIRSTPVPARPPCLPAWTPMLREAKKQGSWLLAAIPFASLIINTCCCSRSLFLSPSRL
jgi:hypothetical protein